MANLTKIATVLELMAEYVEQHESAKTAAVEGERTARIEKIASTHLLAHGESMSDVTRLKLAKTDFSTLQIIEDLLTKQAGVVDALGAPAHAEAPVSRTTKEAADAASQQFVNWIVS